MEVGGVVGGIRVKGDKGVEDGVGVDVVVVVVVLDEVGGDEFVVLVGLEEVEDLGSFGVGCVGEIEDFGKGFVFDERVVLSLGGEEWGIVYFFLEVEVSGVFRDKIIVSFVFF